MIQQIIFILCLAPTILLANDFDFAFIHSAECTNFDEDSIDYCRIVYDKNELKTLFSILKKNETKNYGCGYRYSFEFVKNNKVESFTWIQPSCEKENILKIISKYFPQKTDTLYVYLKSFPVENDPQKMIIMGCKNSILLIEDERAIRRWPRIELEYYFKHTWSSPEGIKKGKRDEIKKQWTKRKQLVDSLAKSSFSKLIAYKDVIYESGGGPYNEWEKGCIKIRIKDKSELSNVTIFKNIIEIKDIKCSIPDYYHLLLISNIKELNKKDSSIISLNCKYAFDP